MKPPKILLLNLSPTASLGDDLRKILEPSFNLEEVKFWQELDSDSAWADCDKELSEVISRSNAALIFLIQAASLLKRARESFLSLNKERLNIPVVVVVETCEADEMF